MGSGSSANAKYSAAAPPVVAAPVDLGFRTTLPNGSLPGQTVQVKAPDGRLVEVIVPPGYVPGTPLRVNLTAAKPDSLSSPTERSKEEEIINFIRVLEKDADSARVLAQQSLANELQLQRALWASADTASMGASLLDQLTGVDSREQTEHLQALVFAAALDGDAAQLLAALDEAKRGCEVSASLEIAARELRTAEEGLLTWRCLREALLAQDRAEIQAWLEQAVSMGFDAPEGVYEVLDSLYKKEHAHLQSLDRRSEAERRLKFAQEAGEPELLAQMEAEAAELGVDKLPNSCSAPMEHRQQERAEPNHEQQEKEKRREQQEEQAHEERQDEEPQENEEQQHEKEQDAEELNGQEEQKEGEQEPPKASDEEERAKAHTDSEKQKEQQTEANAPQQDQDFHALSTKELIEECRRRGLDTKTCSTREDLLDLLQRSPEANSASEKEHASRQQPDAPAQKQPDAAAAAKPSVSPTVSIWGRRTTPAQWKVHKQYETLYLLGFDLTKLKEMPTAAELRSAYRKAAMESHPDKAQNHDRQTEAKELFQRVKDAFEYLIELT